MVRRMLTELNAAVADEMQETSFAKFRSSMAAFNEERTQALSFGLWDLFSMTKTRGVPGERTFLRGTSIVASGNRCN